ncbi:succinate dehydrogenase assembly factor 2 [Oleomonas cavernae]|uniref:FAD assembly factor SdhE n=1 Tax=Oleomonas cavernae TaxID=2320859 RepID=A0A418WBI3_9PROT|nr:succinate dehydrogenase assembly factor 2 [Oleomonas cavernae]RJF87334.1 succinate dehydrogenase assembly factor 2 [Oleomonas cavernae]
MLEDLDIARRRLRFRSWHRGTKETDLILGSFADAHVGGFDAAQLDRYEALLEEEDPDIYAWLTGGVAAPERVRSDVLELLLKFRYQPRP